MRPMFLRVDRVNRSCNQLERRENEEEKRERARGKRRELRKASGEHNIPCLKDDGKLTSATAPIIEAAVRTTVTVSQGQHALNCESPGKVVFPTHDAMKSIGGQFGTGNQLAMKVSEPYCHAGRDESFSAMPMEED